MSRIIIPAFFGLILCLTSTAQDRNWITPILGVRLHDNALPTGTRIARPRMLLHSPMVGFELNFFGSLHIGLQKDWQISPEHFSASSLDKVYSLGQIVDVTSVYFRYQGSKWRYGLAGGWYSYRLENIIIHEFGREAFEASYGGVFLGLSRRFQWLDIMLRAKANLLPEGSFSALVGLESYDLVLSHRLGRGALDKGANNSGPFRLNLTAGARLLPTWGMEALPNERFAAVGAAPTIGLELLHKKSGLSLNVDKDVWISFNGGSFYRDIKGHIATTSIGVRHHVSLAGRAFRYGLGYSMVRDLAKRQILNPPLNLLNYQMRGLSVSGSYGVAGSLDIEARHIIPLYSFNEPLFNPSRFSLGLIYRMNNL